MFIPKALSTLPGAGRQELAESPKYFGWRPYKKDRAAWLEYLAADDGSSYLTLREVFYIERQASPDQKEVQNQRRPPISH